jgi:hypothetical protein
MEDILEVYALPPDPHCPLVCLDEFSKQLLSEITEPRPAKPAREGLKGHRKRPDSEYVREGSASAFMLAAPHLGVREVFVGASAQRTALDYAEAIQFLCDEMFPNAPKIRLVQDNLNTHEVASLYKRFAPEEARRLAARLEIHYTPKHGSWLNIAEIEISVLARCALAERVPSLESFRAQIAANVAHRNQSPAPVRWQFTVGDARTKLRRLYPSI